MKTRLFSFETFSQAVLGAGRDCCAGPWPIQDGSGGIGTVGLAIRGGGAGCGGSKDRSKDRLK